MSIAIYRHFKNKLYCTMGVSHFAPEKCTGELDSIYGVHTHFDTFVDIYVDKDGNYYHNFSKEPMVLYKSLYDSTGMYVRPEYDFHLELPKDFYPNATQKHRFERVG